VFTVQISAGSCTSISWQASLLEPLCRLSKEVKVWCRAVKFKHLLCLHKTCTHQLTLARTLFSS